MNLIPSIFLVQFLILSIGRIGAETLDDDLCRCDAIQSKSEFRIFNGMPADADGLSFVANVFWRSYIAEYGDQGTNRYLRFTSICTAVILNERWLLASLSEIRLDLFNKLRQSFFVGAGSTDLFEIYSNPNLYRPIKEIHQYPYSTDSQRGKNDLVLIETQEPFELGPKLNIYAACLFDQDSRSFKNVIMAGFGRTSATAELDELVEKIPQMISANDRSSIDLSTRDIPDDPNDLDMIKVKMQAVSRYLTTANLDQVACNSDWQPKDKRLICLGRTSACEGDAGAPMLTLEENQSDARLFVAAIVTSTSNASSVNCGPDQTTRFLLVQPHLKWIRSQTKGQLCSRVDKSNGSWIHGLAFVIRYTSLVGLIILALLILVRRRRRMQA